MTDQKKKWGVEQQKNFIFYKGIKIDGFDPSYS